MKLWPEREVFLASLRGWAWRGALCALPSFIWAIMVQFSRPVQVVEMVAGVVTYVGVFAWITALPGYVERVRDGYFGWALRIAANMRAALAPLLFFGPDMFLGALSITAIKAIGGPASLEGAGAGVAVGWTYATTVVQGALVSATMLLLALLFWGGRALRTKWTSRIGIAEDR